MNVLPVEERLPIESTVFALPQPTRRCAGVVGQRVAGHAVDRRDPVADGSDVPVLKGGELLAGGLLGWGGGGGSGSEGEGREAEAETTAEHGNGSLRER